MRAHNDSILLNRMGSSMEPCREKLWPGVIGVESA
jgi:hypothetical protein